LRDQVLGLNSSVVALTFNTYARRLMLEEAKLRQEITFPLLVWEGPPAQKQELGLMTQAGGSAMRPMPGDALVFEVKKGMQKGNAFAMGITVGRVETNDITIEDNSVSRFHAYFQQQPKSELWNLVDAESMNGTLINGEKVKGSKPRQLSDKDRLRFGNIDLLFYSPETFFAWVRAKMQ
jgi:hypothetical protein